MLMTKHHIGYEVIQVTESLKEASNELFCWFANKQIFILMKNKKNRTEIKCSVEGYPLLIPTEAAYFGKCLCL